MIFKEKLPILYFVSTVLSSCAHLRSIRVQFGSLVLRSVRVQFDLLGHTAPLFFRRSNSKSAEHRPLVFWSFQNIIGNKTHISCFY